MGEDVEKLEASRMAGGIPDSAAVLENNLQFLQKLNRILHVAAILLLVFTQEK